MLRAICLAAGLVLTTTACAHSHHHHRKVFIVDGHRYAKPVFVVHKQPARHLNCWKIKAGRWHCYK